MSILPSPAARSIGLASERHSVAVPKSRLALVSGFVVLVALLAFGAVVAVLTSSVPSPLAGGASPVEVTIGTTRLVVPAGMIRVPEQRVGGLLARLDLALDAVTLKAAGDRAASAPDTESFLFLAFEPARDGADPATRAEDLYTRFLTPEAVESAEGLIRRTFRENSPYNDEELYIAAPDGRAFAARCGPLKARSMPPVCLWQIRAGGLDVQMRFSPKYLAEWQRIAAELFDLMSDFRKLDGGATMP